jgi:GNAT superfamily N-acetyltransferase
MSTMNDARRTVLLLVGLKGAGKTTLGDRLAHTLGVAFLRVEPIYRAVMQANPDLTPGDLEPLGFGAIADALDDLARSNPVVCLESTGTAAYFPVFLERLERSYRVLLVRVLAPPDVCAIRVRTRDNASHIPISDERVREINRIAETVSLPWDLEVDNADPAHQAAAVTAVADLLAARSKVRVRMGVESDREFVLALVPELHAFGPPAWRDPASMKIRDRQVVDDALCGRTPGSHVLVAESPDGERLGFVHVCEEGDYYEGPCAHIGDVVVAPSMRGMGVGRVLLGAAEEWAQAAGYSLLTLNVFVDNEAAARLYKACGYLAETMRFVKPLAKTRTRS